MRPSLFFSGLTFDAGPRPVLHLLPARADEPLLDFRDEQLQVLGVTAHDLVELGELARSEEHFGHPELVVILVETQRLEERLQTTTD